MVKFKLKYEDGSIHFKILEMDESLRGKGRLYIASNGWGIVSDLKPAIYSDRMIFLRGKNRAADEVEVVTNREEEDLTEILQAFNEWREHEYKIEN